ncbi:MAG: hypothetical protein Fur002_00830 [Anaerolineales bacterium]
MFKKNSSNQPVTQNESPSTPPEEKPAAAPGEQVASEVDRLRDILYGSHARSTDKRMSEMEMKIERFRSELSHALQTKVEDLASASSSQLTTTRKELSERLDRQSNEQATELRNAQQKLGERLDAQASEQIAQLRAAQKELIERMDKMLSEQSAQIRSVQKELSERVEKMYADFYAQLRATQKDLGDRVDKLSEDLGAQIRNAQAEARQRDDAQRQELLTLASSLDDKKTSRYDLSQMLVELGQRLRNEKADKAAAPTRE